MTGFCDEGQREKGGGLSEGQWGFLFSESVRPDVASNSAKVERKRSALYEDLTLAPQPSDKTVITR